MQGDANLSAHHTNFFQAIRGNAQLTADLESGHLAATVCHLGNISTRVGRTLRFDPKTENIVGDDEANAMVRRRYREGHWSVPQGV